MATLMGESVVSVRNGFGIIWFLGRVAQLVRVHGSHPVPPEGVLREGRGASPFSFPNIKYSS